MAEETSLGLRQFRYSARERGTGRLRTGETSGIDAYTVRSALRAAGLDVERLEPAGAPWNLPPGIRRQLDSMRREQRRGQRADLADALATLLSAGIPLERALADLAGSTVRATSERQMLAALRDGVRDGRHLDALAAEHPDWFDAVDVALIAVGHRAGELPRVLIEVSRSHQRGANTSHKLVMALSYPLLLLVAALGVVAYIGNQTLPQLLTILNDAHVAPPPLTVAVATFGQVLVGWWWLLLLAAGGCWFGLRRWLASVQQDRWPHTWLARNPLALAQRRLRVAVIAAVLGQLLRNGVPLAEALEVTATTASNGPLRDLLRSAAEGIRSGGTLSQHLAGSSMLDPEFAQLLRVGEQAGELPEMCARIAERYERASQRSIERLAALAEPAAILCMALLVGIVVMAAILPLISLGDIL